MCWKQSFCRPSHHIISGELRWGLDRLCTSPFSPHLKNQISFCSRFRNWILNISKLVPTDNLPRGIEFTVYPSKPPQMMIFVVQQHVAGGEVVVSYFVNIQLSDPRSDICLSRKLGLSRKAIIIYLLASSRIVFQWQKISISDEIKSCVGSLIRHQ